MKTSKERKSQLIKWANQLIADGDCKLRNRNNGQISKSYNGQIAAFSVSIALSGLKPTMAIYYNGSTNADVDRRAIVEVLAQMYNMDHNEHLNADDFYQTVCQSNGNEEETLRKEIVEYAIALKLTVRTFELS